MRQAVSTSELVVCCSVAVLVKPCCEFETQRTEALNMNENAKRNLQRRKRQATRLSKREYFRKKKEAVDAAAAGKDNVAKAPLERK
jgi:hypothetical protein